VNTEQQQQAKKLGLLPEKTNPKLKWILVGALVLVVLALGFWWFTPKTTPMLYKTAPVSRMDLALTVSATGSITPKDRVEVSSELSGIVKAVYVDYNDKVKAGQKLALLDTSKLQATVVQRQSSLRSAQAQVKTAKANLEETRLTYSYHQEVWQQSGGKHPARQVMDTAKAALAKAEAGLEQALASVANAQAELEYAQTDLKKSVMVAPIDGVVLSRAIEVGQTVASSFSAPTLFLLARDLKAMEVIVAVDEADIGVIRVGQHATFSVDAYRGRQFQAQVRQIRLANIASTSSSSSAASSSVVSYNTVLSVDNSDEVLLPSMTAVTDIAIAEAKDTLAIENAALRYQPQVNTKATPSQGAGVMGALLPRFRRGDNKQAGEETAARDFLKARDATIWVLRNNQPVAVPVKIGISNGAFTQIISGDIAEGDLVISDAVKVKVKP
jgi:HlyD family secretion protein